MIGRVVCLMLAIAAAEKPVAEKPAPPPAGVTRHASDGAVRIDAVLPGKLISYALPAIGAGHHEILLLVEPERPETPAEPAKEVPCQERRTPAPVNAQPRWLYRLDLSDSESGGTLTRLRDDLPPDSLALDALDIDADSKDELLLTRPGGLYVMRDIGDRRAADGPLLLMSDPAILEKGSEHLEPRWLRRVGVTPNSLVPVMFLGGVRFYGPTEAGRSWDMLQEASLTLEAQRSSGGLRLSSPRVRTVGRLSDQTTIFASGPEPDGGRRLRTVLLEPMAAGGSRRTEVWSALPGSEALMESRYLMLDSRPALVVTTRPAEKLSLFGEKMVRLFFLDGVDRSRNGAAPVLAADSHMNLWQTMTPVVRDVDGDGREDLILGYWKGLKDDRVVLDTHLRREDGSFATSPVSTDFDVEKARRVLVEYGRDLDGDGGADLLLLSKSGVLIHPGPAVSRGGHDLVEKKARYTIPVASSRSKGDDDDGDYEGGNEFNISIGGGGQGTEVSFASDAEASLGEGLPRAIDLDGDGVSEIIVAILSEKGRGLLQVIRLVRRAG